MKTIIEALENLLYFESTDEAAWERTRLEAENAIKQLKESVVIPDWQMKRVEDTLRVTSNIHKSQQKVTCHDRMVCKAWDWTKESLKDK
jgi:hypothetical protein